MSVDDLLYPFLKVYMKSPQAIKTAIGNTYSLMPAAIKYGKAYSQAKRELEIRNPYQLELLCDAKLLKTLAWAIDSVPAYRKYKDLLFSGLSANQILQHLPFADKSEYKKNISSYLSGKINPGHRLKAFTGGSLAAPLEFYLQKNVTRSKEKAYIEDFQLRLGIHNSDVRLLLRGRNVNSISKKNGSFWSYEPIKKHLILSSDHMEPSYMQEYIKALHKWMPAYCEAFPSALYPLAKWLYYHPDETITRMMKGVMLYSENVFDYQMELFTSVFKCPVLKHYGHSERVLMAATIPDDNRYFFWPHYGKLELVDTEGNVITKPGIVGEIVGTSYDNQVMPFIRYKTEDYAMYSHSNHPKLPGFPVCERIEGRLQEFIVCRDHRLISITTMGAAHFEELAMVDEIQYEQSEPGMVVIKIVSGNELSPVSLRNLQKAVVDKTQGGCEVEIHRVENIPRTPRGKHKMLVQHLDISGYLGASCKPVQVPAA